MSQRSDLNTPEKNLQNCPPNYTSNYQQAYADDEIDLRELWHAVWSRKWGIALITVVVMIAALVYALNAKNYYRAQVVLAPVQSEGKSAGLAAQFGGLASLAGINLGGGGASDTGTAIAILQSRKFGERFIQENNLKPYLFSKSWDADKKVWIEQSPGVMASIKALIMPASTGGQGGYQREPLAPGEPSLWDAYKEFSKMLTVSTAKDSGFVTVSVEFTDPVLAAQWATQMVQDINQLMKTQSLAEAQRSNAYLEQQLKKTSLAEVRQSIYQMMEANIKTMMLANTSDDVVFKTIDPAVVPEEKSKPKRSLIMAVAMVLGLMLGVFWALIRNAMASSKKESE
ncbi:Wzz/FepE/Etk N-terminal domain-containing protein [Thiomicrorhabdus xiamenensis]|uniref:LPS O-antigen length regulator n=1 Tax=Thiomicrorhabdus xiamenensis TaxID=2739063 RepID=A0A7D4SNT2_9GAMM|nr:Wzz/FepE/Etk N-terminal domain-containing protein [Thiomicrorhabdus xiamenensis]QKI89761.1 LPS O-antigen length regulator [Thiomicrorhabdus xiamenensis]